MSRWYNTTSTYAHSSTFDSFGSSEHTGIDSSHFDPARYDPTRQKFFPEDAVLRSFLREYVNIFVKHVGTFCDVSFLDLPKRGWLQKVEEIANVPKVLHEMCEGVREMSDNYRTKMFLCPSLFSNFSNRYEEIKLANFHHKQLGRSLSHRVCQLVGVFASWARVFGHTALPRDQQLYRDMIAHVQSMRVDPPRRTSRNDERDDVKDAGEDGEHISMLCLPNLGICSYMFRFFHRIYLRKDENMISLETLSICCLLLLMGSFVPIGYAVPLQAFFCFYIRYFPALFPHLSTHHERVRCAQDFVTRIELRDIQEMPVTLPSVKWHKKLQFLARRTRRAWEGKVNGETIQCLSKEETLAAEPQFFDNSETLRALFQRIQFISLDFSSTLTLHSTSLVARSSSGYYYTDPLADWLNVEGPGASMDLMPTWCDLGKLNALVDQYFCNGFSEYPVLPRENFRNLLDATSILPQQRLLDINATQTFKLAIEPAITDWKVFQLVISFLAAVYDESSNGIALKDVADKAVFWLTGADRDTADPEETLALRIRRYQRYFELNRAFQMIIFNYVQLGFDIFAQGGEADPNLVFASS